MSGSREARTETNVIPIGGNRRVEPPDANVEVTPTREAALAYHEQGRPGKLEVVPTKAVFTQRDLSMAYTPGVAEPCREIQRDRSTVNRYTARRNLVAVISNGTAVLGLGNVGALAGKPVMEGKALLFKRFADVDVFDLEIDAQDPGDIVRIVRRSSPRSAASTSRTSKRRTASSWKNGSRRSCRSRCFTTISTARRS
jgi:malic enzyme